MDPFTVVIKENSDSSCSYELHIFDSCYPIEKTSIFDDFYGHIFDLINLYIELNIGEKLYFSPLRINITCKERQINLNKIMEQKYISMDKINLVVSYLYKIINYINDKIDVRIVINCKFYYVCQHNQQTFITYYPMHIFNYNEFELLMNEIKTSPTEYIISKFKFLNQKLPDKILYLTYHYLSFSYDLNVNYTFSGILDIYDNIIYGADIVISVNTYIPFTKNDNNVNIDKIINKINYLMTNVSIAIDSTSQSTGSNLYFGIKLFKLKNANITIYSKLYGDLNHIFNFKILKICKKLKNIKIKTNHTYITKKNNFDYFKLLIKNANLLPLYNNRPNKVKNDIIKLIVFLMNYDICIELIYIYLKYYIDIIFN